MTMINVREILYHTVAGKFGGIVTQNMNYEIRV